jgi:hypothetical protein
VQARPISTFRCWEAQRRISSSPFSLASAKSSISRSSEIEQAEVRQHHRPELAGQPRLGRVGLHGLGELVEHRQGADPLGDAAVAHAAGVLQFGRKMPGRRLVALGGDHHQQRLGLASMLPWIWPKTRGA